MRKRRQMATAATPVAMWAVVLAVCIAVTLPALASSRSDSCSDAVHVALVEKLKAGYPGWNIVSPRDLIKDDRTIWTKKHGSACPGVARGNFDGSKRRQYAILLQRKKGTELTIRLIHAVEEKSSGFRTTQLFEDVSSRAPVITRKPPGSYFDAEDRKTPIKVANDVIYLETLEAGVIAFYLVGGETKRITISL